MTTWQDVINNPEFSKESPETQLAIREDYFNKVIAPKVEAEGDDINAVREDFYRNSGLPSISPSPTQPEDTEDPGIGDIVKEAGRGLAQTGVNLANSPGWVVNQVLEAVGVPKDYQVMQLELPESMKPQTESAKLGAEIGGYLVPVGAPLKAAEGAGRLARLGTGALNMAAENVVGATAQATQNDDFTGNLAEGMAGSALGGAALKAGRGVYRGLTGRLSDQGVEASTETAVNLLKAKGLHETDLNIRTQLQEAEAAKRALANPKSETISEDLLKGNPVLSRVADAGIDMSSKQGRKQAIKLIDEDVNVFNELSEQLRREIDNTDPNAFRLFETIKRNEAGSGGADWSTNLSYSSPEFQKALGMNPLERGLLKAGTAVESRLPVLGPKMSQGVSQARRAENQEIFEALTDAKNELSANKILNKDETALLNQLRQRVDEGAPLGKSFALTTTEKETYNKLLGKDVKLDDAITRLYRMGNYASNTGLGSKGISPNMMIGAGGAMLAGETLGGLGALIGAATPAAAAAMAGTVAAKNIINQSYKRVLKDAGTKAEALAKKGYGDARITAETEKMIRRDLAKMFKDQGYGEQSEALAKALSMLGKAGVLALDEE